MVHFKEVIKRTIKRPFRGYSSEKGIISLGHNRLAQLLRPRHIDYLSPTFRDVQRDGIHYRLDISNWIDWHLYFGIEFSERLELYKLISNQMMIIDIGANIGQTALNMAQRVGPMGKVYAFEPIPDTFNKLKHNCSLNPKLLSQIKLYNFGLGSKEQKGTVEIPDPRNIGMNRLSVSETNSESSITIKTLDQVALSESITKVDLMKIDVEGFEMQVLCGAESIIQANRPILFIELDDMLLRKQNSSAKEVLRWLGNLKYSATSALDHQVITVDTDFKECHFDLICKPV